MWRLANHAVFNISITGVNALSNEMIIDIILQFILKIIYEALPRSFTLHSLVARQQESSCDLSKKYSNLKESIIDHNSHVNHF